MTIQAKNLGSVLRKGFIPLDIQAARRVGSTAGESWGNATVSAGYVSSASAPRLTAISTTARVMVLDWASASLVQVQFPPVTIPPDFSTQHSTMSLHILAGRNAAASSDATPVWQAAFYGNTGSSVTATASVTATSSAATEYTMAISTAASVAYPGVLTVLLNPVSTADNPKLYAAWIEYGRHSSA